MKHTTLKIPTQGLGHDDFLSFEPYTTQCGNITDGVGLSLSGPKMGGWWVISFENLECMYLAAKKARTAGAMEPAPGEVAEGDEGANA